MQGPGPVAIINAGGWGTALAVLLAGRGLAVRLWARRAEAAEALRRDRVNTAYLPGVPIPDNVTATADLTEAVSGASVILLVVISAYVREIARQLRPLLSPGVLILHGVKGLEKDTLLTPSQVLHEEWGEGWGVVALSGPTHAEEVGRGVPTAAVAASASPEQARAAQQLLNGPTLRVYSGPDIIGVELCAASKNVVALAAGMGDGLGYGDNAKAALITRSTVEMGRLVRACGGKGATVAGLAGIGDLIGTCTSRHSRNRWAGEQLGSGKPLSEVLSSTRMVVEGVPATRAIAALAARRGVEMPICQGVYRILFEGESPAQALARLMARDPTAEAFEW